MGSFSRKDLLEIRELLLEGKTTYEIAKMYDTVPATISRINRGHKSYIVAGIRYPIVNHNEEPTWIATEFDEMRFNISIKKIEEIIELLRNGFNYAETAELVGVEKSIPKKVNVGQVGYSLPNVKYPIITFDTKERNKEIYEMWQLGYLQREIADKFGLAHGSVSRIIKQMREEDGLRKHRCYECKKTFYSASKTNKTMCIYCESKNTTMDGDE